MKSASIKKVLIWALLINSVVLSFYSNADAPHIRTSIRAQYTDIPQCLEDVSKAVSLAGFDSLDIDSNDVEGTYGDYSTETICMESKILIIVAGPDTMTAAYLRSLIAKELDNL